MRILPYTQLPLQHRINLGSTVVNIGCMNLIPTSNVISTTFHTFVLLTVLPEILREGVATWDSGVLMDDKITEKQSNSK